jgi:hypothetical protein
VAADDSSSANQKFILFPSKIGNSTNKISDGTTNQAIPSDNCAMFTVFLVSKKIQTNANIDIVGKEANIAPQKLLRLAISDNIASNTDDNNIFKT